MRALGDDVVAIDASVDEGGFDGAAELIDVPRAPVGLIYAHCLLRQTVPTESTPVLMIG